MPLAYFYIFPLSIARGVRHMMAVPKLSFMNEAFTDSFSSTRICKTIVRAMLERLGVYILGLSLHEHVDGKQSYIYDGTEQALPAPIVTISRIESFC